MPETILDDFKRIPGILKSIDKYKYNPAGIQRIVLQHLKDVSNGLVEIVDPTNPFVFSLESSAVNTAAFMIENEVNTRRLYPAISQTPEDLYIHMSDKDFIDRFSTPSITTFSIMIQKEDLLNKLVDDPLTLGKKITIPRNSEFIVADTIFSLQYPIDIKQLTHGGIQIVYDTTEVSPLQSLPTNVIDFEIRTDSNLVEWIYFEFVVSQFKINSINSALSSSTGFNQSIAITDEFYYARVYFKNNINGAWVEIYTTHTDQVYDPNKPTAVLSLVDKNLNVYIPQIYFNSNLIQGTLRVDVYETKGEINLSLEGYLPSAFTAKWKNINKANDNIYTAVMSNLAVFAYSSKTISGGSAALTFPQLRERVIKNAIGGQNLPITNVRIESRLAKRGYEVVKNIDVVTNRVFLATRSLPKPIDEKLITAGASSIETLISTIKELVLHDGVKNNGKRITITPEIVFKNNLGIIEVFNKIELNNLLDKIPDDIAKNVTANNYLYTPFHYVLDTNNNEFQVRPYFMDKPLAKTVSFISQNVTTGLQINTKNYSLTKNINGYKLTVVTKSNANTLKLLDDEIHVQLSYVPMGEDARAFLNGKFISRTSSNEFIFEFDLSSNLDIDSSDNLALDKFLMFTTDQKTTYSPLENQFDIIYSTSAVLPVNWRTDTVDLMLGKFILPNNVVSITREKIKILFGYSLKTLWSRSRSVVGSAQYQKHTMDIPWIYETDIYKQDPITGSSFSINATGDIVYTKLHSKGDPVLDTEGLPAFRYRVGDTVFDAAGNPIASSQAEITRQIDLLFIEGAYYFATDSAASNYRNNIVDTIVSWLTVDLTEMNSDLLEQTRLYFYPNTNMGIIKILADDGKQTNIEAGQYFVVDLIISNTVYNNAALREALRKVTITTIDNALQQSIISMSNITSLLRESYGNDVISFTIKGLGGSKNLAALTIINNGEKCNIRKRLVKLPDNNLIVEEDITINYIKHDLLR